MAKTLLKCRKRLKTSTSEAKLWAHFMMPLRLKLRQPHGPSVQNLGRPAQVAQIGHHGETHDLSRKMSRSARLFMCLDVFGPRK